MNVMIRLSVGLAVATILLSSVCAQDYQRLAPKEPARTPGGTVSQPEPKLTSGPGADTVLLDSLKGLVFLPSPNDVKPEGASVKKGVEISAVNVPDAEAYRNLASGYLGKKFTKGQLDDLIAKTVLYYRDHDRPVVDVIVPEQDITSGVVQVVILEGKVGQVSVSGNRWFSNSILTDDLRAKPGDTMRASRLQSDLDWINQNPFRSANLFFSPGANLGDTNLELKVKDRFPLRVYTGYEDSGDRITGYDRYLTGFNYGNLFGTNQQLNYQYTTSGDFNSVRGHAGSYLIPLPWRHNLTFFGSYAESKAETAGVIQLNGISWQASTRYEIPLGVINIDGIGKWRQNFSAGFDFKQSNNNLGFGGDTVFDTTTDVVQWVAGYKTSLNDPFGTTSLGLTVTYSPGNLTENNSNADFGSQRFGAQAEYAYETFVAERNTRLPWDFSWILRGTVQTSNGNLLSSEQLGAGGYLTNRGYDMNAVTGDEGFLFTTELRTPAVSLAALFSETASKAMADQLQFLTFWDYSQVNNVNLQLGESSTTSLASAGVGVRYSINTYLNLRFDYGWQLHAQSLDEHRGSRANLGLVLSY